MLEFEDIGGKTTSRLISLPCRPPRGKNGDVCLDEFAIYLPRLSKEIYTAASFCTLRKGCIEVGSTPLGTIGKFYEICTDRENYPNFDRYFVPWWYARVMCKDVRGAVQLAKDMPTEERVERFGTDRLISLYRNSTLEDFQQECECVFIDSSASYISLDLIYANTPGRREDDIPLNIENDEEYFNAKRDVEIHCFKDADEFILNYSPEKYGSPLYMGLDIGEKTVKMYCDVIADAKTAIWNGPMGVFEMEKFAVGTKALAEALSKTDAISIIGGGDSAAAVEQLGFADKMTHISTGGGASLEFLEGKILPGIDCLQNK